MIQAFQNCSKFENRTKNGKLNNPTKHVNSVEAKIICDQVKPDELDHYISWHIYIF